MIKKREIDKKSNKKRDKYKQTRIMIKRETNRNKENNRINEGRNREKGINKQKLRNAMKSKRKQKERINKSRGKRESIS